jgi:hypothetical protein
MVEKLASLDPSMPSMSAATAYAAAKTPAKAGTLNACCSKRFFHACCSKRFFHIFYAAMVS